MSDSDLEVCEPEEAPIPLAPQNSVRIVGTSLPVYPSFLEGKYVVLGISVGRVGANEKTLCIKLKLDRMKFGKLRSADANVTPERRKWPLSL